MSSGNGDVESATRDRLPYLNDNLIEEILIRATLKTLHRSLCVCRHWRRLITGPAFMDRLKSLPPLVVGFYGQMVTVFVCFYNLGIDQIGVDTGLSFLDGVQVVLSSDKGLLLCSRSPNSNRATYTVCNPLSKEWLDVPLPDEDKWLDLPFFPDINDPVLHTPVLFCYESQKSDGPQQEFKVICFITRHNQLVEVDTYSSETRRWTKNEICHKGKVYLYSKVLFNKSVYFVGQKDMFGYDLNHQSIRSMKLPEHSDKEPKHLGVSAGSLFYILSDEETNFKMWVLVGECEWSLKHKINLRYSGFVHVGVHPLDPDTILLGFHPAILYNIRRKEAKTINDHEHLILSPSISYCLPHGIVPCLPKTS